MNRFHTFLAQFAVGAFVLLAANAHSQVLYQDTSHFVGNFNNGNGEMGNQVSFPGAFGSYVITKFVFQFDFAGPAPPLKLQQSASNSIEFSWAVTSPICQLFSTTDLRLFTSWTLVTNQPSQSNGLYYATVGATNAYQYFRLMSRPTGNEVADLRFYMNDGPPIAPSSNAAPGTVIYDSGFFPIGGFTSASLVTFRKSDLNNGVVVPQNFTWTVKFAGLSPNENAGLGLYEPTTVGTNFNAAWVEEPEGWQFLMAGNGSPPPNFGAVAYGTPLPQLQSLTQNGVLELSWPTNITGFSIEKAVKLTPPIHWVTMTNISVVDGQNVLSNPASGRGAFFRLVNHSLPTF